MTDILYPQESPEKVTKKQKESLVSMFVHISKRKRTITLTSSQAKELDWLLKDTRTQINNNVTEGLLECKERLIHSQGSKLVISSGRSEALKGIVVRVGTGLLSCDLKLKLATLPAPHNSNSTGNHAIDVSLGSVYTLAQVVDTVNLIDEAVEGVRRARYGNSDLVLAMLTRLLTLVRTATSRVKCPAESLKFPLRAPPERNLFTPELPRDLVINFYLEDSSIVTDVRVISEVENEQDVGFFQSIGLRTRRTGSSNVIEYNGRRVVEVERHRVESQDPNLISATAKLKGKFILFITSSYIHIHANFEQRWKTISPCLSGGLSCLTVSSFLNQTITISSSAGSRVNHGRKRPFGCCRQPGR